MANKPSPESEKTLGTFIKVVSNLASDHHGQVAGVYNAIIDYQRFDPSFSNEKALPYALRLLDWFYGPQNSTATPAATTSVIRTKAKLKEDDLRQKAIQRMEPFVVRMRERVKEKGPDHVELAERLEQLGISEDTTGGNAAISDSTAQTAKKRSREEDDSESVDGESDGQSDDDEDNNDHRKSKLRRITTSDDVELAAEKVWKSKSVKGTLQHHLAEDRCDACKDNQNTICAIKPNSISCIWCRVKKKKCVRNTARSNASSKASGESSNGKGKGKERESHPQAVQERSAASENRSQQASSSDTDAGQREEIIPEKRRNGHPRNATVMRNSFVASAAGAGTAVRQDSQLIASHSQGSGVSSHLMPPPKPPQAIQANSIAAMSRIPSSRAATPAPEVSRLTTSYFQRTQRYVQMRARYTDALADLLKAYDNLMSDVDKLTEAGLFPEVLNPDSWFKDEITALLIGSERYRREHPDQWEELIGGRNVPVAGSSCQRLS